MKNYKEAIEALVEKQTNIKIKDIQQLPLTASNRMYYRLILTDNSTLIAVYNDIEKENMAFFSHAKSLETIGAKVPKIYQISDDQFWYLQDDLGTQTLFDFLNQNRALENFESKRKKIYQEVIEDLIHIQTKSFDTIDFSIGFPRPNFDKQSIDWDLNYFKYYFLKLSGINFDEQLLEDDFKVFSEYLLETSNDYFLYRDFQSRNIMLLNEERYYIDFQGGRKGPLQYDLASLLFDSKASLDQAFRKEMLDYYVEKLPTEIQKNQADFKDKFWSFTLIRVMQAMGAYGYRGLFEKKQHFIDSIPLALENLELIMGELSIKEKIPYLYALLEKLAKAPYLQKYLPNKTNNSLKIQINSFSYKIGGIPKDTSDNGGGFAFDCRAIHNPGRYEEYKQLTGMDKEVIDFFKTVPAMDEFLAHVYEMVDASVNTYLERGFTSLMVNFGCTGGQHRSVYSAEKLSEHLKAKFNLDIELHHIEQEKK